MADSYWRYSDSRQPPPPSSIPPFLGKRPRSDYVISGSRELASYYSQDGDRGAMRATRDSDSIGASYDLYLRDTQLSSFSGSQSARPMSGGMPRHSVDDPRIVGIGGVDPGPTIKDRTIGFGSGRPEPPLPPS